MKTPTTLTAGEIDRLTGKIFGAKMPRAANKERAIGRLLRTLVERIGEERGREALREILSAPGAETAEGRLYAAIEEADALRAETPAPTADLADNPKAAANEASWAAIPDHGTASGAAKAKVKDGAAPKREGKRHRTNWSAHEEEAKAGRLPPPPDFSAPTHARFRGKLADLTALAEAGDVKGLEAFEINPVSSSPKTLARYRDICVIALKARGAK